MPASRVSGPDNFVQVGQQWSCIRCPDSSSAMTLRSAIAHATTAKHRRAVERYIANLNTPDDFFPGDPFLDSINQFVLTHPPTPPAPPHQTHESPPRLISPPRAIEVDSLAPDAHLVPRIYRTAIHKAVNKALDAFLLPDESDESEALGDVEDAFNLPRNVETPTEKLLMPSTRRRGAPQLDSVGARSPWPDRIVDLSVTVSIRWSPNWLGTAQGEPSTSATPSSILENYINTHF